MPVDAYHFTSTNWGSRDNSSSSGAAASDRSTLCKQVQQRPSLAATRLTASAFSKNRALQRAS